MTRWVLAEEVVTASDGSVGRNGSAAAERLSWRRKWRRVLRFMIGIG
jgi:hypothetical protein